MVDFVMNMRLPTLHRWRQRGLLAGALLLSFAAPACAYAAERASVEAAIVYNILLFAQWPGEDTMAVDAPLVLCLDSNSPLFAVARQLDGHALRRMKLSVQSLDAGAGRCQALYEDSSSSQKVAQTLAGSTNPVLVISGSGFEASEPPTVQLFEQDGRLAFDISQHKARQAGLQVSSKLLRLARKVVE